MDDVRDYAGGPQYLALMTELTHAVAALLLPPTGALPLLIGAWWLRPRRPRTALAVFTLALVALWAGSTELGAQTLQKALLGEQAALSPDRLRERPSTETAIVVLGAGARQKSPEYGSSQLKNLSIERLRYGVWLARSCGCPMLFTGGTGRAAQPGLATEAALADRMSREEFQFTPRWLEDRAADTRENAQFSAAMLKDQGIRRVILVTHDLHMRRALRAFRQALPTDVELVAAPVGVLLPGFEWSDLLPSQGGIARARYLGYEWLGYLAGH